ncbi:MULTISPECIES: carbohydrate ABC transporter permease [Streptomyces]|uniref:carbohydrate ABC transporter permease n=1 Tax=Streptomyces TaxID=1883 RepID=UPI000241A957|nr:MULTISPECIES: sugar ABC transporter permease [Streptomyces]EHM29962.1 binding-protein-dependent transport systems inner membrane component [Streptomyces sp. W007]MCX4487422.1 sugar ABC transporter permease [Streptomyces anulatus]MCX4501787.1 sugar ABC transporter permease [Streptomyces anulatus]MCX4522461.1 sugar ABC transporter permease [Streptomyces anulatus]MCX4605337.1 sugar ABC transporter permease [Streptomyces anulatus]
MALLTPSRRPAAVSKEPLPHPLPRRRGTGARKQFTAWLFLVPALLIFGLFAWWPIVRSLLLSFQRTNLVDPAVWVGLDNFRTLFADPLLGTAVGNTVFFVVLGVLIGFPAPLILAAIMSTVRRGAGVYRFLVYLPVVIPPVVAILLWKWFYDPGSGLFNNVLGKVGLGPYAWLESSDSAMVSLVLESTWAGMGGAVLIYLAAMVGIPGELYEAAEVDGAGIWRRIWHVMLPQLRSVIGLLLLVQLINTVQVFTEPYVFTGGGPENSTLTVLLLIFRYAFQDGEYGQAAALSFLMVLALALLSAVYLRATRSWSTS